MLVWLDVRKLGREQEEMRQEREMVADKKCVVCTGKTLDFTLNRMRSI